MLTYTSGQTKLFVYVSQFAGRNLPEMKREGAVHVAGKMRTAWFKDPDGNIRSLVNDVR